MEAVALWKSRKNPPKSGGDFPRRDPCILSYKPIVPKDLNKSNLTWDDQKTEIKLTQVTSEKKKTRTETLQDKNPPGDFLGFDSNTEIEPEEGKFACNFPSQ
jgi:hypothetical protein